MPIVNLIGFASGHSCYSRNRDNQTVSEAPQEARDILEFWLGDSVESPEQATARKDYWYRGGKAVDDAIESKFGHLLKPACAGELDHWMDSAEGAAALVILLDQFTRNTWRGTVRAYAGDAHAHALVDRFLASDAHRSLPVTGRIFLYHPFHHSETLTEQDRGIALVDSIRQDVDSVWHNYIDRSVAGFTRHRNIVADFGRFPHRNEILGRSSTPEELAFLQGGAENFGQAKPKS